MTRTSFTQPIHAPAPDAAPGAAPGAAHADAPVLDAERLDVFHVAVEFHGLVPQLTPRAAPVRAPEDREPQARLCSQVSRAPYTCACPVPVR